MNLYINSCVRADSRTDKLARAVLERLGNEYEELFLPNEGLMPLSEEMLNKRTELLANGQTDDEMFKYAHQFANADRIVISAPFWDGSFPSALKVYIENIYAVGIVSAYSPDGAPIGLCKASELIYVTTAGGKYIPDFSFDYITALCKRCFGINNTKLVFAENLDIEGYDAQALLDEAIENIDI
ncbi:MAG: NAD(P)H-dependent oxidoreductase [Ruminococcus sp.]|nr:NAD(P)H-dependent oxidoreductase [Ruminococcus sp.]